jgi:glycosyltransferase involved in cell wall biosynthesis
MQLMQIRRWDKTLKPEISLIVATIGRVESLRRLLESLVQQDAGDTEIIVVDQEGPGRSTYECLQNYEERLNLIHIPDDGVGLSRARNLGLRRARGKILGFPDDDCWYGDEVLSTVRAHFSTHRRLGVLSGIYSEPGVINEKFPRHPSALNQRNLFGRVCSVGLFIQRDCIDERQLYFDEAIGAGTNLPAGEEVDLALRLLTAGAQGLYAPSLVVFHRIERNMENMEFLLSHKEAFWYVVGKNLPPLASKMRLLRGLAGYLLNWSPPRGRKSLQSILRGYKLGCERRRAGAVRSR